MEEKNRKFYETIRSSSLSKTIRNSLVPTKLTQKNIERTGIILEDQLRAEKRQELKDIMDDFYRHFITETLSNIRLIEWTPLFEKIENNVRNNTKETKSELEKIQKQKREELYGYFKRNKDFSKIFSAKLITEILPEFIQNSKQTDEEKQEKLDTLKIFNKFTTSFKEFFENRKNVFSKEDISTSICYRVVNDNAWLFYQNMKAYKEILNSEQMLKIENNYRDKFDGKSAEEIFSPEFYGLLMTQESITFYNDICGLINKDMNLYYQQNKQQKGKYLMKRLHKQILCVSESNFEVPKMFDSDKEVYDIINEFLVNVNKKDLMRRLSNIANDITKYDFNKIYISNKNYETMSIYMYNNWKTITENLELHYDSIIKGNGESKKKKIQNLIKNDTFKSIKDLDDLSQQFYKGETYKKAEEYIRTVITLIEQCDISTLEYRDDIVLLENEQEAEKIKNKLDDIMNIYHWIKIFLVDEEIEKDMDFYSEIEDIYEELSPLVSLYNRVRNYVTQKPYSQEKMKLNFGSPTLADGWSKSKEFSNNAIIMLKDGKYYIGIFNIRNKPNKEVIEGRNNRINDSDYKKMVYRLLPGANKMLPKVMFSKKGIEYYNPSQYILSGYNSKKHIKSNENFDINFCHDLIDFFKESINKNEEWKNFDFKFSDTESYNDISEFYREVEQQGYKIEWVYISEQDIEQLEKNGQLYIFQIYNKDFAKKSIGNKNLHTMYLENLFSEENLKDVVLKLNGEAEIFFRKSSIKKPIVHKAGSILVNKCIEDETGNKVSFPDDIYNEIYQYMNGMTDVLSERAQNYYEKVKHSVSKQDIVKDYRYTVDKYFIHLPITINFKASSFMPINDIALKYIAKRDDIHIIGIDRGERNLIYVSVIDLQGNIVYQKNYNVVNGYDYKAKLRETEIQRDNARKNWKEIGKIKQLKEGYLSLVVHEIAQLIVKYNAIVVMEDLNMGFKRGRFKVERQVYQKFENMLINKLNYLVDKNKKVDEDGGLLRGYQLTYVPGQKEHVGKQCGFIFYVPAAYTSKIDPTTGFVSIFNNKVNAKEFVTKFDSIKYNKNMKMFELKFDYNNFETYNITLAKSKWTIYTNGIRLKREYNNGRWNKITEVDLTKEMANTLKKYDIEFENNEEILKSISQLDEKNQRNICNEIKEIIKLIVQLRNSMPDNGSKDNEYDKIISPVLNENNYFYDSSEVCDNSAPENADANGAYCIAMKGLYQVIQIKENWSQDSNPKNILGIKHYEWFDFMQNKRYL